MYDNSSFCTLLCVFWQIRVYVPCTKVNKLKFFPLMPLRRDLWERRVYPIIYFDNNLHVIKDSITFRYYMIVWLFSEFFRNVTSLLWHSRSTQSACEMTFPISKFVITFCVGFSEITYKNFHKMLSMLHPHISAPPLPSVRWSFDFPPPICAV